MTKEKWTKEEEEIVIKFYPSCSTVEEFKNKYLPNRSINAICGRISKFDIGKRNVYSKEDEEYLIKNYETGDLDEICKILGKNKNSLATKAKSLGLKRKGVMFAKFTEEEEGLFLKFYDKMPLCDFKEKFFPNRTESSIMAKANKLGVLKRKKWSKEEDKIIEENMDFLNCSKIAELLPGRNREMVLRRMNKLFGESVRFMRSYSNEEIQFIRDNFEKMTDQELGEILHRTWRSVKWIRSKMQIWREDSNASTNYPSINAFVQRRNKKWRKDSSKKCGYKCILSGGTFEEIHHLYGRNLMIKETAKRLNLEEDFDINSASEELKSEILRVFLQIQKEYPLGVCLTKEIHSSFHDIYGRGNNTPEQFIEFVEQFYPEKLDEVLELIKTK